MNNNLNKRKYRWEECFAKVVLEQTFPDRFFQLEIVDKPDLQNTLFDVGVEVTTAVAETEKEKDRLFSRLVHECGTTVQRTRSKERIRQLGGTYNDIGVMTSWVDFRGLSRVYATLETKLAK